MRHVKKQMLIEMICRLFKKGIQGKRERFCGGAKKTASRVEFGSIGGPKTKKKSHTAVALHRVPATWCRRRLIMRLDFSYKQFLSSDLKNRTVRTRSPHAYRIGNVNAVCQDECLWRITTLVFILLVFFTRVLLQMQRTETYHSKSFSPRSAALVPHCYALRTT